MAGSPPTSFSPISRPSSRQTRPQSRIRKAGFAIRYTFNEFVNRYHVIMKDLKLPRDSPQEMAEALAKAFLNDVEWTIGHRMIFLKDHHGYILEQARDALLTNAVVVIQRAMKNFLRRRKRHKQTSAAVLIQKTWRGYQEKRAYQKVRKGITRLQAIMKARNLSSKYKRMREEKQRAEQERLRKLEQERQKRENEAKLKKAQEEAEAQIQEMFSFIKKEEETYSEKAEQPRPSHERMPPREPKQDLPSSTLGSSLVDGIRRIEQFNRPALLNYNSLMLNGYGRVTQSHSSELALTLTALILGLACQQGSTNEDQAASSRDKPNNETISRDQEFVSPLRSKPKGPQGSLRWRSGQS